MKIIGRCETPLCGRIGLFVRRRSYSTPATGWIKGKIETCGKCNRRIKQVIKEQALKETATVQE